MLYKTLPLLGVALFLASPIVAADKGDEPSYVKVEVKGTLQTGIMAIGGETTGTVIKTKSGTFELELSKELQAQADKLNGKTVVVTGNLTVRPGVEVRQRSIITVATLKAADAP